MMKALQRQSDAKVAYRFHVIAAFDRTECLFKSQLLFKALFDDHPVH